jgi:hypothetical protein
MKIVPGVTFTRLPQGGAVLVNGRTLALAEYGEPEAVLVDHLLTHGLSTPADGTQSPPPDRLRRMAEQMIESGWLLDERRS